MDYKGFGLSDGLRGYIPDKAEFHEENYQFVRKVRDFYRENKDPKTKFFTLGYSQGGAT